MNNYNFHLNVKIISGTQGRACAAAAYQSGEKVHVDDGTTKYFGMKKAERVIAKGIDLPIGADEQYKDRSYLWNTVERIEKSRYARRFKMSLPDNVTTEQQQELVQSFIADNMTSKGLTADWAIHCDQDGHNPHVHILATTRPINQKGKWVKSKYKSEYVIDKVHGNKENGYKVPILDEHGNQKVRIRERNGYISTEKLWLRKNVEINPFDSKGYLVDCRKNWADLVNSQQRNIGSSYRWTEKSYKERGLAIEPTIHEGHGSDSEEKKYLNQKIRSIRRLIAQQYRLEDNIKQAKKDIKVTNEPYPYADIVNAQVEKYINTPLPFVGTESQKVHNERSNIRLSTPAENIKNWKSVQPLWSLNDDTQLLWICQQERLWRTVETSVKEYINERQTKEFNHFVNVKINKAISEAQEKIKTELSDVDAKMKKVTAEIKVLDKKIRQKEAEIDNSTGFFDGIFGKSDIRKSAEKELFTLRNARNELKLHIDEQKERSKSLSERLLQMHEGVYTQMQKNFAVGFRKRYSDLFRVVRDAKSARESFKMLKDEQYMRVFRESDNPELMNKLQTNSADFIKKHYSDIVSRAEKAPRATISRPLHNLKPSDKPAFLSGLSAAAMNSQTMATSLYKSGDSLKKTLSKAPVKPTAGTNLDRTIGTFNGDVHWALLIAESKKGNRFGDWKFLSELEKEELLAQMAER